MYIRHSYESYSFSNEAYRFIHCKRNPKSSKCLHKRFTKLEIVFSDVAGNIL